MATENTIIIGGGLTGLFLAHRLHLSGQQVTLLEARPSLGGRFHRPSPTVPYSSPGLDFISATFEHLALLEWLKNQSPLAINYQTSEHYPRLFDDGKWKPFVGFGAATFHSASELSACFSHPKQVDLTPGFDQLVRALVDQLPFAAQTQAEVTGFTVTGGRITEVVVNNDKRLKTNNVVFTGHPTQLNAMFQGEDLAVKHRTRLAKMESWTAVTLELNHSPSLEDDSSIRLFSHAAKEFEPVVGRIFGEMSKWLTLVPAERAAEHEFIGQCIRHIKRQLKRAWPLALADKPDQALTERIYVQSNAYGQQILKTREAFRFPEIPNLYLGHHSLASALGELGAIESVKAIESLMCGTLNKLPELGASC